MLIRWGWRSASTTRRWIKCEGVDESIFETTWDESVEKFDDLDLKEEVFRTIYGYGFWEAITNLIKGHPPTASWKRYNCTGTARYRKTGAFIIVTLQIIDIALIHTQALIVVYTREFAYQVYKVVKMTVSI